MKRSSELKRSAFKPKPLNVSGQGRAMVPAIRPRRCDKRLGGCGEQFTPRMQMQKACGPKCAQAFAAFKRAKEEAKRAAEDRKQDRARREAMKTRSDWIKDAQDHFNRARRLEELKLGRGCISCGRSQQEVMATDGWKPGGAWDCGHFLSVGSHPNLRFEPLNAWLQCKSCNAGSGKYARKAGTVSAGYVLNLTALIGAEAIERLRADQAPRKHTIEELKAIRDTYRAKARALEKS